MNLLKTISSFIILVPLLLIPTATSGKNVADNLAKAQFTTHISKRKPVDNITSIDTAYKHVYFFVDVRDCNRCDIEHEWSYRGKVISSVTGNIKSDRYRWWSKKNLSGKMGDWKVTVYIDEEEVYSKIITYHKASLQQKQARPIKKRVLIQQAGECELQLRYFSDKAAKDPEDAYYQFMLKKWGKRCLPE